MKCGTTRSRHPAIGWAHVGTDDCYIALQEPHVGSHPSNPSTPYKNFGVNHLAWVTNDFDAAIGRIEAAGYRRGIAVDPHPHRRRAYQPGDEVAL